MNKQQSEAFDKAFCGEPEVREGSGCMGLVVALLLSLGCWGLMAVAIVVGCWLS